MKYDLSLYLNIHFPIFLFILPLFSYLGANKITFLAVHSLKDLVELNTLYEKHDVSAKLRIIDFYLQQQNHNKPRYDIALQSL